MDYAPGPYGEADTGTLAPIFSLTIRSHRLFLFYRDELSMTIFFAAVVLIPLPRNPILHISNPRRLPNECSQSLHLKHFLESSDDIHTLPSNRPWF